MTDPTDKSMLPDKMTISIPTASTPVTAVCVIRLDKLRGVIKIPPVAQ